MLKKEDILSSSRMEFSYGVALGQKER